MPSHFMSGKEKNSNKRFVSYSHLRSLVGRDSPGAATYNADLADNPVRKVNLYGAAICKEKRF